MSNFDLEVSATEAEVPIIKRFQVVALFIRNKIKDLATNENPNRWTTNFVNFRANFGPNEGLVGKFQNFKNFSVGADCTNWIFCKKKSATEVTL